MNQRVHSFMSGCLTLKLSLSCSTVTTSSFVPFVLGFGLSFSSEGEMGIVLSGTWAFGERVSAEAMVGEVGVGELRELLTGE